MLQVNHVTKVYSNGKKAVDALDLDIKKRAKYLDLLDQMVLVKRQHLR